jgi:hypothetical protein
MEMDLLVEHSVLYHSCYRNSCLSETKGSGRIDPAETQNFRLAWFVPIRGCDDQLPHTFNLGRCNVRRK